MQAGTTGGGHGLNSGVSARRLVVAVATWLSWACGSTSSLLCQPLNFGLAGRAASKLPTSVANATHVTTNTTESSIVNAAEGNDIAPKKDTPFKKTLTGI